MTSIPTSHGPMPPLASALTLPEEQFLHIITGILGYATNSPTFRALQNEGINSIVYFLQLTPLEIDQLEWEDEVTDPDGNKSTQQFLLRRMDQRNLKIALSWSKYLYTTSPGAGHSWNHLTRDDLDSYLVALAKSPSGQPPPPQQDNRGEEHGNQPIFKNQFLSNVKLDIKHFPPFNGKRQGWLRFRRGVVSVAATHGLKDLLDPDWIPPHPGNQAEHQLYLSKCSFLYAVWVGRITDGAPMNMIRKHELTQDGRAVYLEMKAYYESRANLEQLTQLTLEELHNLRCTHQTNGGIPKYTQRFRDLVADMADAGKPMDPDFIKSTYLSKIRDSAYTPLIDTFIGNPNCSFDDCAQILEDKFNRMSARKDQYSAGNRRAHNSYTQQNQQKKKLTDAQLKVFKEK